MNTLITGASSGIGEALAIECAKRGDTLFLCGRDENRLGIVAARCRDLGATVSAHVVDVRDSNAMREWVLACDAEAPLERVFANAGVSTGDETEENAGIIAFPLQMRLAVWFLSILPHWLCAAANRMLPKKVI